jgi:hypothetical protein
MFDFQRLSKEDYKYMGSNPLWEYLDACTLLASFEMEVAKEFGESEELYSFRRRVSRKVMSKLEKSFHDKWGEWSEWLEKQLDSYIPFVNVLGREDEPIDDSDGSKTIVYFKASFNRKDLMQCLTEAVASKEIVLDMQEFDNFLKGKAIAPHKFIHTVEKIVEKIVEKEVKVPMSRKDMAKALSSDRNPIPKGKVEAYVLEQFEKGCTCWHTHMLKHVLSHFKSVEKDDVETADKEKVLKSLSEKVIMKTVKGIYIDKGKHSLIFDKRTHGGQRNRCELHFPSK